MKPSEYHNIGQYLREVRENARVSVEQAASILHIRPKYLRALESGDFKDLPGKAYIRGYIKTYAQYLGLNVGEVVEAYEVLLAQQGHDFFVPVATLKQNLPSKRVLQWSMLAIVLLYAYWYFAVHDRTEVSAYIADVPQGLIQSLDNTLHDAMDSAWKKCMEGGDSACFLSLRYRSATARSSLLYDVDLTDHSPRKP